MVERSPVAFAVKRALAMSAMVAAGVPALAQDQTQSGDNSDAAIAEVVVTGSRIAQPNLTTTSPVTQVTAEDVQLQGVTRIEDLVNQLPQAFAAQNSTVSNGATGTATISLRNLGSRRTLVLVDGRRLPYGDANNSAGDLNEIPTSMVERVEVLTGGASAVYGSDAIAGVVNFIMKKNFEGIELSAQYGFYNHENDFGGPGAVPLRTVISNLAATNPAQFRLPDDEVNVGYSREFTLTVGVGTDDGRGNMTAYGTYRRNDAILQAEYDYSSCSLNPATGASFACGGSGTSFPGRFTDFATFNFSIDPAGAGNTFRPFSGARDNYNFGPLNYYQRPDERYTMGVMGHYELNDKFDAYVQLMYADNRTVAQIAPSGSFFNNGTINCDNPFLSASQATAIGCSAANIANGDDTALYIGRRNVEGGGRQYDFHSTSLRAVTGLRGNMSEAWTYDVSNQFSRKTFDLNQTNDFATSRLRKALEARLVNGVPTCQSVIDGSDPNCVPVNFFQIGGVTQAALNYLQVPTLAQTIIDQNIVNATVTGDLEQYGWKLPSAEQGIQIAIGAEYRRDKVQFVPDVQIASGDITGAGGPQPPVSGSVDVNELFMEGRIPLVQGKTGAQQLGLEVAYRYSDYGNGVQTDTYKLGADWAPVEDVRFRASYQKAIRAANILELFTAQGFNLFDMNDDPCDTTDPGANGTAPAAACQGTNPWQVSAAQAASGALTSPAGQYNFLQGGNTALVPEDSDTVSFGVVITPSAIPGLFVSIDYYDIQIDETISTFGAENTINACYRNNDAPACARITRNPANGALWVGTGVVQDLNINIGSLETKGFDLQIGYSNLQIGNFGKLNFSLQATKADELITNPGPGLDPYECVGFYSSSCGTPTPDWRHRFRVGWNMPWKDISLALTWRYLADVELFQNTNAARLDASLGSFSYFDLAGAWQINDKADLRIGINNLLDKDPPLSGSVGTTGNGNTYPQTYDALGRFIFGNLTWKF